MFTFILERDYPGPSEGSLVPYDGCPPPRKQNPGNASEIAQHKMPLHDLPAERAYS